MAESMNNTCPKCGGPTRLATDAFEQSCASCNRIKELEDDNARLLVIIEGHRNAWDTFEPHQRIRELETDNENLVCKIIEMGEIDG
jgi:hypothetical protein